MVDVFTVIDTSISIIKSIKDADDKVKDFKEKREELLERVNTLLRFLTTIRNDSQYNTDVIKDVVSDLERLLGDILDFLKLIQSRNHVTNMYYANSTDESFTKFQNKLDSKVGDLHMLIDTVPVKRERTESECKAIWSIKGWLKDTVQLSETASDRGSKKIYDDGFHTVDACKTGYINRTFHPEKYTDNDNDKTKLQNVMVAEYTRNSSGSSTNNTSTTAPPQATLRDDNSSSEESKKENSARRGSVQEKINALAEWLKSLDIIDYEKASEALVDSLGIKSKSHCVEYFHDENENFNDFEECFVKKGDKKTFKKALEEEVKKLQNEEEGKDDNKHGWVTKIYPNGDKYEGEWKDDKQHGTGTYY